MSMVYDAYLAEQSRPYTKSNLCVCAACVNDDFIYDYVSKNGSDGICSFCRTSTKIIPVNNLLPRLEYYLQSMYSINENDAPVDGGEFVWDDGLHFFDIIDDALGDSEQSFVNHLKKIWDTSNLYYKTDITRIEYEGLDLFVDWDNFAENVIDEKTFDPEYCAKFLDYIGKILSTLDIVKTIPVGENIYRARKGIQNLTASALGAPPKSKSRCNRLSFDGNSCFYGAFSKDICLKEIGISECMDFSMGIWTPCKDLHLIDLSDKRFYQCQVYNNYRDSIWDSEKLSSFPTFYFLYCFIQEISHNFDNESPAEREKYYRPTQFIGEYFRNEFEYENNKIDGIIYCSAKDLQQKNVVVFCDSNDCCDFDNKNQSSILMLTDSYISNNGKQDPQILN